MSTARRTLQAWVRALNAKGPRAQVDALFTPRATLLRFIADEPDTPPQRFTGPAAITRWLSLSPPGTRFSLVPRTLQPLADGAVSVGYKVDVGAFENFGRWTLKLDEGGRIRRLEHRPQPVPERWRL